MIEKGDIVSIYYTEGEVRHDVEVLHAPMDVGDMWYFKDATGNIIAQNPSSSHLDFIIKYGKESDDDRTTIGDHWLVKIIQEAEDESG